MSVEKVTKTVRRCVCKLPDCPGKGEPWFSKDDKIPARCRWCQNYSWNGLDRRHKNAKESANVESVTKVVNRCVCELPDCPGKREPWFSKDDKIPARCRWCKSTNWNGQGDRRRKNATSRWMRIRVCEHCGGTDWVQDSFGAMVCAHCVKITKPAIQPKPKPAEKKTGHALGCKCTLCWMAHAKKPSATITLPKPRKVRNPE